MKGCPVLSLSDRITCGLQARCYVGKNMLTSLPPPAAASLLTFPVFWTRIHGTLEVAVKYHTDALLDGPSPRFAIVQHQAKGVH